MPQTITFEQSRRVDQVALEQYGMDGLVLMENAGSSAARRIAQLHPGASVLVLCGKGNNGGDGYVIARHLQLLRCDVHLLATATPDELSGDAAVNARIAARSEMPITFVKSADDPDIQAAMDAADVIVDCLLGTGVSGSLRSPFQDIVALANAAAAVRIAIDVPTGWPAVQAETSIDAMAFVADRTLTFVAVKAGMNENDADRWTGVVEVIGIGVPKKLLDDLEIPTA
ncbi:NAD(P)H-hydrate epimerase [Crateriforma conspicua]|uniref:NAD(P)H-hydrate epimerase n=1 Tax=Crateriforma conspicua TaxID=2527996 RepID=UPI00118AE8A7|nr:NAD(P)H-hydrate epimerase [Crateriforma conspicua]QDV64158.1 Bifunctional NAD(P)H-hydrate repair enzyme Nnr [Crateriforma conspicua]